MQFIRTFREGIIIRPAFKESRKGASRTSPANTNPALFIAGVRTEDTEAAHSKASHGLHILLEFL
jgi:hypothetical protein